MASEVTFDGHVIAPLNIQNPAPTFNLRGFQWDTVDDIVQSQTVSQGKNGLQLAERDEQAPLVANSKPSSEAPQDPRLPGQLAGQLGIAGRPAAPALEFPLTRFEGAFAGNGFNMIFRPNAFGATISNTPSGPNDNILELNLTTEQLTFGPTLGKIPNRGFGTQPDIILGGVPYLQTIQDVTNEETGRGNKPNPTDIHFEPGVWLTVPQAEFQKSSSVVRMASIPHGTTINAQGPVPNRVTTTTSGGTAGPPRFDVIDTTPFQFGKPEATVNNVFTSMNANQKNELRIPKDLTAFIKEGTITSEIIKNPNIVLQNAIKGQTITDTVTFEVSTGPPTAKLNGGGTANISFLSGKQATITNAPPVATDNPNAHAELMTSKFWIETVAYKVNVPKLPGRTTVQLRPAMPPGTTAPTPIFDVTTPPAGVPATKEITIPGIQIQYSQTVNLMFGPKGFMLTWPHVSVATLVPTYAQKFQMT